ncbi:MAG: DUF4258 domain-containing protein [Chlorobiales bacterium]|nr:DUF4258 domain-containing protein [Chlorobiales bacterium]
MQIENLLDTIRNNRIRITDHTDEETHSDQLTFEEVIIRVVNGEIIEDYPTDKPFPSCLIYGENYKREPIHSVWAYNPENKWAVLITVYRPDPDRWIDWKTRRK